METFREFAFTRFLEALRLYQPEQEGPTPSTLPKELLYRIIHLVPVAQARNILQSVGIQGRKGLTQKNFTRFKQLLVSAERYGPHEAVWQAGGRNFMLLTK